MLKKYQQQTLAIELLKRHARVKIVHQVTGIPIKPLRWVSICARIPTRGTSKSVSY